MDEPGCALRALLRMLRVLVLPRGNDRVPLCARFLRHSAHSYPGTDRGLTVLPARPGVHPCLPDTAPHVPAASPIGRARRRIGLYVPQRSRQPDNPQPGLPRPRPLGAFLRGHQLELCIWLCRGLGVGPHPARHPSRARYGLTLGTEVPPRRCNIGWASADAWICSVSAGPDSIWRFLLPTKLAVAPGRTARCAVSRMPARSASLVFRNPHTPCVSTPGVCRH